MRRKKKAIVADSSKSREQLVAEFGQVLDTRELAQEFIVTGIIGNLVVVRRKTNGGVGTLQFQNMPRYYYRFTPQTTE